MDDQLLGSDAMSHSGPFAADIEGEIHLYGWNDEGGFWHGPTEVAPALNGAGPILRRLMHAPGTFHGKIRCNVRGLPGVDFQTTVYNLTDAGLAMVHLDGDLHAPIGVVAVIPAKRRRHVRPEFAFGFVSFLSFLGAAASPDSELAIHDYLENVLRTDTASALVFTVEGAQLDSDTSIVTSAYFENLAIAMLEWLDTKHAEPEADDDIPEVLPSMVVCAAVAA
jgi:hypothetical protein